MSSKRNWNRPWTTQEIIDNSENWSLAGDVALLNTLKHFANNLLTKTDELNDNINNLLNNLEEVSLKLDISQNEFQSLKNTQFIESRVYDDDETLDSKGNEDKISINSSQKEEEKSLDISLTAELQLLDKYYETVEISVSDSEDESEKSFVLKPRDIYEDRPLPPLIGSEEWYKNWYLDEDDSDVDSQRSEEIYSESDSDDNLPKDLLLSETSSELDFSHHTNENRPVLNSTLKDVKRKPESVTSSEGSEDQPYSLPAKGPMSNKAFAEQLAAKLDNVISKEENIPEEINSKPIQTTKPKTFSAGLFSDEPPPLSDTEDTTMKGIFSTNKNLFDEEDDEDSLFWDKNKKVSPSPSKGTITNVNKDNKPINADILPKSSQVSKGLFDSDNSEDDDIFITKKEVKKSSFLQPPKTIVPLIDDEPPSVNNENKVEQSLKKKPVGGVSILGNQNIGDILKKKQEISNQSPEKESAKNIPEKVPKEEAPQKPINLFDDNENLFSNTDNKPKPKKYNLFDDDDDIDEGSKKKHIKNTSNVAKAETLPKTNKIKGLFDDDDNGSGDDDIFNIPKKPTSIKTDQRNKYDLFSNTDALFEENDVLKPSKISIFDDFEEKNEDKKVLSNKAEDANKIPVQNQSDIIKSSVKDNVPKEKILPEKDELFEKVKGNNNLFDSDEDDKLSKPKEEYKSGSLFESDDKRFDLPDENKILNPKSKIISLFDDDDDDDDDDLFSNVTKKIDFKLFEEPESTDDMFSIKTEVEPKTIVKTTQVEKTDGFIKNNSTIIKDDNSLSTGDVETKMKVESSVFEEKMENKSIEKVADVTVSQLANENNFKTKNGTLFDDGLVINKEPMNSDRKDDSEKQPTKPIVAEKPKPSSSTTIKKDAEQLPTLISVPKAVSSSPPVVSLFDSTPPPDDGDWDTKSDTFSDTEDFLSYRADQSGSTRSNLFDNEPPSLYGDESSGIMRHQQETNVIKTNDSSLNRNTVLSRRLPSDIFSDQQSQDSFIDNESISDSRTQSHLSSIPEASDVSSTDITSTQLLEEVAEQFAENEINKSVSSDNVFDTSKSDSEKMKPEIAEKIRSLENRNEAPTEGNGARSPKKIASITEMLKSQGQKETTENKVIPGKLKQNLNINVNALLPGYSQPKIKTLIKSQSLDSPSDEDNDTSYKSSGTGVIASVDQEKPLHFDEPDNVKVLDSITKERVRIPVKRRPSTRKGRQEALRKSAIDIYFDSTDESNEASLPQAKDVDSNKEPPEQALSPASVTSSSLHSSLEETVKVTQKPLSHNENYETDKKLSNTFKSVISPKEITKSAYRNKSIGDKDDIFDDDIPPNEFEKSDLFDSLSTVVPKSVKSDIQDKNYDKTNSMFESEAQSKDFKRLENRNTGSTDDLFGSVSTPKESTKSEMCEKDLINKNSLFDSENQPKEQLKSENKSVTNKDSLFNFENPSTELTKSVSEKRTTSNKPSIFGSESDSDEEDLFGSSNKKKTSKSLSVDKEQIPKVKQSKSVAKQSLFDDNSSDDDLFAGTVNRRKSSTGTAPKVVEKKIRPSIKKLANVETDVDPLSSLLE